MSISGWKSIPLKELAQKITKGTTPTTLGFPFVENGINFIKAESILLDGSIDTSKFVFIDSETNEKLKRSQLEEDDILFSMAGMVLGKVGVVKRDFLPANTNQALAIIRLKKELALPQYVAYFMRQKPFFDYVNQSTGQSAQPNINLEEIGNLEIKVPSITIQKSIVEVLSVIDEKIELNRQANETLGTITQSLYREWFINNMDAGHWREIPLPEVIDFLEGPGIRNWQYTNSDEGIRFINIRCIQNKDVDIKTANRINENDVNTKYPHFLLQEDDIVVSTSGTLGRFAVIRNEHLPLLLNTSVIRMRPIDGMSTWSYLLGYIESEEFQFELESRATGSVQKNFGPMHLKQILLRIPPYSLLRQYEEIVKPIHRKILQNLSECQDLEQLRDTLLPKLMSGEIAV